jgi:hypothetical protein
VLHVEDVEGVLLPGYTMAGDGAAINAEEGEAEWWQGGVREKEKWKRSLLCWATQERVRTTRHGAVVTGGVW